MVGKGGVRRAKISRWRPKMGLNSIVTKSVQKSRYCPLKGGGMVAIYALPGSWMDFFGVMYIVHPPDGSVPAAVPAALLAAVPAALPAEVPAAMPAAVPVAMPAAVPVAMPAAMLAAVPAAVLAAPSPLHNVSGDRAVMHDGSD
jgi:hypothetical protein